MSFFSNLFGGGKSTKIAVPPAPKPEDELKEDVDESRRRRNRGLRSTIATSPLGVTQSGTILKTKLG